MKYTVLSSQWYNAVLYSTPSNPDSFVISFVNFINIYPLTIHIYLYIYRRSNWFPTSGVPILWNQIPNKSFETIRLTPKWMMNINEKDWNK